MGCFSSKEESFRFEDVPQKRTLSPTNSRQGPIISGLDSSKFLPLVRKPRNTFSSKKARILKSTDVPIASVLSQFNDVEGGNDLSSAVRSPANIISASKPHLQPEVDDTSEEFSFAEKGKDSDENVSFPTKVLKSIRVTPSLTQELPIEQLSIYSPTTYVTPRFGSYGGLPIL